MHALLMNSFTVRDRIVEIIDTAIAKGELKMLRKWETRDSEAGKAKKPRKAIDLSKGKASLSSSSSSSSKARSKAEAEERLIMQMMANRDRRAGDMASICSKYAVDSKGKKVKPSDDHDIPDDEFEKLQGTFLKGKTKK
jgi:hypothetical protein